MEQLNVFSPAWTLSWAFKWLLCVNFLIQFGHLNSVSALCTFSCAFKRRNMANTLPHIEQLKGFLKGVKSSVVFNVSTVSQLNSLNSSFNAFSISMSSSDVVSSMVKMGLTWIYLNVLILFRNQTCRVRSKTRKMSKISQTTHEFLRPPFKGGLTFEIVLVVPYSKDLPPWVRIPQLD